MSPFFSLSSGINTSDESHGFKGPARAEESAPRHHACPGLFGKNTLLSFIGIWRKNSYSGLRIMSAEIPALESEAGKLQVRDQPGLCSKIFSQYKQK